MDENLIKAEFISNMLNKYDYLAFKDFCINNGYTVPSFHVFALMVEPPVTDNAVSVGDVVVKPAVYTSNCSSCGGGIVK